ncbi:glutamyl-tRNA reductase [Corynebacterium sp. sy017]|uniref:glutamyl-tRNA reductase n=1 Tax=unclassified Corynebacterium TaxID=2624378 RepID=UPI0011866C4C|nr:glutamyl-tRNA reductase [Corynebacterium sp. SY003]MBP3089324.1 glutamyl-tRNA reductase [Corynebacterium sp. sy017]TSD90977.1 glutamyl-tRNA reductase [Corynebacterium sp. SY003]
MSALVVGMSHRSAPVALLEQLSMDNDLKTDTTRRLVDRPSLAEAMIVSTCNRFEVYAVTSSFHTGVSDIVSVLHEASGVDIETLRGYLYVRYADAAVEHVMVVTAGMDSMVVGEQQIIGQVRSSYHEATQNGTVGPTLHGLVQAALHTGKRVHNETDIDESGASMVSFALEQALVAMELDPAEAQPLRGKKALVLGAGAMASLAATHAGRLGVAELIIANRTFERAQRLAHHAHEAQVNARAVPFEERDSVFAEVDLIISAIGAAHTRTMSGEQVAQITHPLTLVDLALPRDIDDNVCDNPHIHLINIEKLHASMHHGAQGASQAAQHIVNEELAAYNSAQRMRDVVPVVSALRRQAADIINTELARLEAKTPTMSKEHSMEVHNTVRRVVDKLLHQPTVRVKELAATAQVVPYDQALQELFGLQGSPGQDRSVKVGVEELPDNSVVTLGITDAQRATAGLQ